MSSICPSFCPSIHPFLYSSFHPSIHLSIPSVTSLTHTEKAKQKPTCFSMKDGGRISASQSTQSPLYTGTDNRGGSLLALWAELKAGYSTVRRGSLKNESFVGVYERSIVYREGGRGPRNTSSYPGSRTYSLTQTNSLTHSSHSLTHNVKYAGTICLWYIYSYLWRLVT